MISNALILDSGAMFLMTFPQTFSVIKKWQSIFKRDHHTVAIIPLWHTISMMVLWVFNGGRGEWGISRCPSNYPFKFTPFVGGRGKWGTEYNKVENFWTWNSSPSCKWKFPPNMTFGTFGETSYKQISFISLLIIDDVSKFIITKQEWRAVTLKINFLI